MEPDYHALNEQYSYPITLGIEGLLALDKDGYMLSYNEQVKLLLPIDKIGNKKFQEALIFYAVEDQRIIPTEELSFYNTLQTGEKQIDHNYGIMTEEGHLKWLSFSSKIVPERSDMHMIIAIGDVTRLITENKDLLEKKKHLQLLVASLDDLVFEVTKEGVFTNYWTSNSDLLFYKPDEFLNKNLKDLFPLPISKRALELIDKALTLNKVCKMEFISNFDTHKGKWYKMKIMPIHLTKDRVAIVVSDISEKVESLEKIRFNQHKFNQAFHFSGLGISLTNLKGNCIEANKTLSKILGFSQEELSTINFLDYTHPDDLEFDYKQRQRLARGEIDSFTLEKRYQHKLGHYIWCSVTISAVHNQFNELSFFIVQLQDISDAKKNREILERQKHELELVKIELETKVKQLEDFNQIVAHNLRGPVSNIHMLLSELKDESNIDVKNEYLDLLKTSNDSLTDTLEELSEILELRENTNILKDNCNFSLIYTKIYSQFIGEIQSKNAQLTADFQVENIHYPTKYLESIFNNLLSNALKFTDPNIAPQIHIRTYIEDNTPIFSIEDNGIGIDLPKYKSQLFMFRKVFHRGFDSKGIGLFITRYQVEALGGKIDIKSAPGKGTTFLVRFLKTTT